MSDLTPQEEHELLESFFNSSFKAMFEKIEREQALDEQIEQWRKQKNNPRLTRVIVHFTNNTPHTFDIAETNLQISESARESFQLCPQERTAFKLDLNYNYAYPWGKNKTMFHQFIDFTDQTVGLRLDFGLIMNTAFGLTSPTLKPAVKNSITSTGSSRIKCSTKTSRLSEEAPFNFEIEVTLG